uniref:Capsid protein n=1 Tax=Cressdnaviricota sp. TaxID=2748378 RepID=A0A6M3YPC1_9VIRU|nr:MAG: capsid protein [Cressdnaviricota sp.]QJI53699.1 MAG: capsid protein [Cressdnaviricota sp.]QKN88871.1 MAG: capsid protein [Cressdnaviricota sp.]
MVKYSKKMVKKPRVYKRKVVRKPTKALAKLIQRVVSRNIENKSRQANLEMNLQFAQPGGTGLSFNGLIPLTPYDSVGTPAGSTIQILQGTGQGGRVGNVIKTKYATLKGVLAPLPLNATTNPAPAPMEICIWIFKLKDLRSGNQLITAQDNINNQFFQSNNSTTGVTGSLINIVQAINQDNIHLYYKRVFKVGFAAGQAGGSIANNEFSYNRKFSINITKYLPKTIKFDDNTEMPSVNHVYCYMAPFKADGAVSTGAVYGATCDWEINYIYEDA